MSDIDVAKVKWDAIDPSQVQWDKPAAPRSNMQRIGEATGSAMMRSGPMAIPPAFFREIGNISQEGYDRLAYRAGGGVTDIASNMGASPPVAAGAGYLTNVGIQALPVIAGGMVGKAFEQPMRAGGQYLMQSAMKPSQVMRESGAADRAATTMLERGISPTRGGREQLQTMVTGLENQIDDILKNSPATVDKFAVGATLKDAVAKVRTNLSARADTATIQNSLDEFLSHPLLNDATRIPVSLANQIKQSIYRTLGPNAYAPGVKVGTERLADKTLARGLREQVAAAEPAVVAPMAQQAELLNALKVMTPQALREGNKNIVGLGALSPTVENALVWMLDRSPYIKGLLARGMYSGSGVIPVTGGAAVGGLLGSQSGKPPQ